MVNLMEDAGELPTFRPYWWSWYNWPTWWTHFNGIGRIRWNVRLEPGKPVDLGYAWHYFSQ